MLTANKTDAELFLTVKIFLGGLNHDFLQVWVWLDKIFFKNLKVRLFTDFFLFSPDWYQREKGEVKVPHVTNLDAVQSKINI